MATRINATATSKGSYTGDDGIGIVQISFSNFKVILFLQTDHRFIRGQAIRKTSRRRTCLEHGNPMSHAFRVHTLVPSTCQVGKRYPMNHIQKAIIILWRLRWLYPTIFLFIIGPSFSHENDGSHSVGCFVVESCSGEAMGLVRYHHHPMGNLYRVVQKQGTINSI
jgi:hypothetical protein